MKSIFGRDGIASGSIEHARTHAGELYKVGVNNAALGAAAFLYIQLNVPAGLELHVKAPAVYNSLAATLDLLEAPTITDGTTAIVPRNKKRSSTHDATMTGRIFSDPTAISAGTTLDLINFTGALVSPDGPQPSDMEWILKQNTKYVFRLQNNGGGASTAFLRLHFYEQLLT